ncbi:MAG: hypothetical protein ACFE7R_05210 [Candidatus Hodarchaeota archaeon]
MNATSTESERPRGYLACIILILTPIVFIILWPVTYLGISSLPWALLLLFVVVVPLFSCGTRFRGRPLFQFHYHGEPFEEEIMSLVDDEHEV